VHKVSILWFRLLNMEYGQQLKDINQNSINYFWKQNHRINRFTYSLVLWRVECLKELLKWLLILYKKFFHIGGMILVINSKTTSKFNGLTLKMSILTILKASEANNLKKLLIQKTVKSLMAQLLKKCYKSLAKNL
jgi:hypothetical protein